MRTLVFSLVWVTVLLFRAGAQPVPSAEELLARLDRNEAGLSSHFVGSISVDDQFGRKVTGFESWSLGNDRALVVFTSGDDKGQKILRLKDSLYVAYPEADKPVKIQGSALRDSVAGSDFSYEDMAGDQSLVSRYSAVEGNQEPVNGEPCAILDLKAKVPGLTYPIERFWVSLRDFSARKLERFSQNGRLLKTLEVLEVGRSSGRIVPTKALMSDALRGNSKTLFDLTTADLDVRVDPRKFTLEELTW